MEIRREPGWIRNYYAGCRPRATSHFCFGKSDQNHVCPCAAPPILLRSRLSGIPPPPSRIKMARKLAPLKQPSPKSRFGTPAPPHTKARLPKQERSIHLRHRPFDVPYYLPKELGAGLSFLTRSSPALGVAGPPARILPLGEGCLSGASS